MVENKIELKVAEAMQEDVGKGIARIDKESMNKIGVNSGDAIIVEGNERTVATVDRAYPADVGLGVIRVDGLTRKNSGASIGERVKVGKAEVEEAKSVAIAPAKKGVRVNVMGKPRGIKRGLMGRAILKGDFITLGGSKERKDAYSGGPYEDIFDIFEDSFFGSSPFGFKNMKFMVVSTNPRGPVLITDRTKLEIKNKAVEVQKRRVPEVTYEDIGGLDEQIRKVREMVELPMKHPELFQRLGIEPPKGILLKGPPGTGKTLLGRAVANESDAYFKHLNGPEVMSKWVGSAEKKLRKIFEEAKEKSPAIIFIDELDAIASKREEAQGQVEKRVVAQLLTLLDGLEARGKVMVLAASNRPEAIDPALRRPGRFDREIELGVPDRDDRLEILKIHTRHMPLEKEGNDAVDLEMLANVSHGYTGADVEALCKEAAIFALRRARRKLDIEEDKKVPREELEKLTVKMDDFKQALKLVEPSAMREVLAKIPKVQWKDIGGLEKTTERLKEMVEWPLKYPEKFKELGIEAPKGILLYGPPGCGKTLLAKAVANESEANFISIKGPELLSKWVGESEKAVREIFSKARQVAPAVVFFDEIDSLVPRRTGGSTTKVTERVVNQILTELDGLEELTNVIVIGATNRPDIVDPAILRPGRLDRLLMVPRPDEEARREIFKIHTRDVPLEEDVDLEELADKTEGYSGADIKAICREAALEALRKDKEADKVGKKHFEEALKEVRSSLSEETEELYEEFEERRKGKLAAESQLNYMG